MRDQFRTEIKLLSTGLFRTLNRRCFQSLFSQKVPSNVFARVLNILLCVGIFGKATQKSLSNTKPQIKI